MSKRVRVRPQDAAQPERVNDLFEAAWLINSQ